MKKQVSVLAFLALGLSPLVALAAPDQFNFDGTLLNDGTSTPMTGPVSLKFQILDKSATCVIFEESQASVALDANGKFSVKVGTGTRVSPSMDGGLPWRTVFGNPGAVAPYTNCPSGVTLLSGDPRLLRVTVNNSATLSPDFAISAVPFATEASTLQGLGPASFVSAMGTSSVSASLTGFMKMDNHGELRFSDASTNYVGFKAPPSLGGIMVWSLPPADGTSGQVLTTNGAGLLNWSTPSGGGGASGVTPGSYGNPVSVPTFTVDTLGRVTAASTTAIAFPITSVAGRTGAVNLTAADIAGLGPATTMSVGMSANNLVSLDGAGRLPPVDASMLVNVNAGMLAGRGVSGMTPAMGQVMAWNGTAWTPTSSVPSNGGNWLGMNLDLGTMDFNAVNLMTNGIPRVSITPMGTVGIGTTSPVVSLDMGYMTDAVRIPKGTTAQRPASAAPGDLRFNTTTGNFEFYDGGVWSDVARASAPAPTGVQQFLTSGSFTVPAGVTRVKVIAIGGGGGGCNGGGMCSTGAGGLGAAGYAMVGGLNPGQNISVTVGLGGTVATNGTNGGNTTFGSLVTALGGTGATTSGNGTNGSITTAGAMFVQIPSYAQAYGAGGASMMSAGQNGMLLVEW